MQVDKVHMEAELPAVIAEEGSEEPDMLSREALDEMRREVQELGEDALPTSTVPCDFGKKRE
jgi:hypothetical protein